MRTRIDGSARAALITFGGDAILQGALLHEQPLVTARYAPPFGELGEDGAVTLNGAHCERDNLLMPCEASTDAMDPALLPREPNGAVVSTLRGDGRLTTFALDTPITGARVSAMWRDDVPSALSDDNGEWYIDALPADTSLVLTMTDDEHLMTARTTRTPSTGPWRVDEQLALHRFATIDAPTLLGAPLDFSRAIVTIDTNRAGLQLTTEPPPEATFYLYDGLPQLADETSASGEALLLHVPTGTIVPSAIDNLGQVRCTQPTGLPDPLPAFPGTWNAVRLVCE